MPSDDKEWFDFDRQEIDIRRSHVLQDALKEGHKRRFDPTKLLNDSCTLLIFYREIMMIQTTDDLQIIEELSHYNIIA